MGFWNDGVRSHPPSQHRSSTRHHDSSHRQHYSSHPSYSRSASSFFSNFSSSSRPKSYSSSSRARPRNGLIAKLRKFLRDLYYYMRRHPIKVFMLVIMPLVTGGALTKILSQFGVRLPRNLEGMFGGAHRGGGGERYYARGGARDARGGIQLPGMRGGVGDSIQGAMRLVQMFT